jgi:hypothetical protein
VGYQEIVCMDKFLGRPSWQKVAVTEKEEFSLGSMLKVLSPFNEPKGVAAMFIPPTALAQLLKQQKTLADQIAAFFEDF